MARCRTKILPILISVQLVTIATICYITRRHLTLVQQMNLLKKDTNVHSSKREMQKGKSSIYSTDFDERKSRKNEEPRALESETRTPQENIELQVIQVDSKVPSGRVRIASDKSAMTSRRKTDDVKTSKHSPRDFTRATLTIVLWRTFYDKDTESFPNYLEYVRNLYPTVKILGLSNENKSLQQMISQVETEYFLVLERSVKLSHRYNEGIDALWNLLQLYPEIDVIGGSYLANDKLHVACHRYRLCGWKISVSYEYKRSLGNAMICDGTSSTFMGRTKSILNINGFDDSITSTFIIEDFFLRARKSKDIVVATVPSVIFQVDSFPSSYYASQLSNMTTELIPFALKHKIFIFQDIDGQTIDLCDETSPLSGKYFCDEKIAHELMLNGGHWAYTGIFAYPYMLSYLKKTLSEVTRFFEEKKVKYAVVGGVSLGAIKMRSILPWEAGDIDIRVYEISLLNLATLMEPWAIKNGYDFQIYKSVAVHIYCTPSSVGRVSGGLATIYPQGSKHAPDFVRIKTNGIWVRYERRFHKYFLQHYGKTFLQHKGYQSKDNIKCKIKNHPACLPNFIRLLEGKAGTSREYFCDS